MRSGYAGKIQIGVIFSMVKDAVDHLRLLVSVQGKDRAEVLT